MKKIIISLVFMTFLIPNCKANTSFKTFTPLPPNYNNFAPPPPQNYNYNPRHYRRHNYDNYNNRNYNNYNNYTNYNRYYPNQYYNNPYYNGYYPKRKFFSSVRDFFSGGQMTGYTPSYNSSFNSNPYGYKSGYYDSNGNYIENNYGFSNGASIKILD